MQADGLPENLLNPDDATGYKKKASSHEEGFSDLLTLHYYHAYLFNRKILNK